MPENKTKKSDKTTHVNIELSSKLNLILTESASLNKRTKRAEASIRLNDHLEKFGSNWLNCKE